jgi:hypothetical protein
MINMYCYKTTKSKNGIIASVQTTKLEGSDCISYKEMNFIHQWFTEKGYEKWAEPTCLTLIYLCFAAAPIGFY